MKSNSFVNIDISYFDELRKESEELVKIKTAISNAYVPDYFYNEKKQECIKCQHKTNCENGKYLDCRYAEILVIKINTLIEATKKYALYNKDAEFYDLENAVIEITQN